MENGYYHLREIKNIISPPSRGLNGGLMVYFLIQRLTVYPFETRHAVYKKKKTFMPLPSNQFLSGTTQSGATSVTM